MSSNTDTQAKQSTRGSCLDKAAVLTRISIARHLLGLFAGLVCGALAMTGILGFVIFGASNVLGALFYYVFVLGIDADEHGGHGQFTNEGLMPGFAVFLVCLP